MEHDSYADTEAQFTLRPVLQPLDAHISAPESDIPSELAALWAKWFPGKEPGQTSWHGLDDIKEVFDIAGIDISQNINPGVLDEKMKELLAEAATVHNNLTQAGLMSNHMTMYMIRKILNKISAAEHMFNDAYSTYCVQTMQPSDMKPDDYGYWRFIPIAKGFEPNPGQRARIYAINDLAHCKLRRYRDGIVKRITTPDGLATCAWERQCSIFDYTKSLLRRRLVAPDLWSWLTTGAGFQPVEQLSKYLEQCEDPEIPFIEPDRHIFSFRNGVYIATSEQFIPYARAHEFFPRENYPTACKHFDMDFVPEDVEVADPMDIPTPGIETLFDTQEMSPDVRRWAYCLLGRLMYNVGELDDWQILPFIKGLANTGKSVLLNYVREFYEAEDIGVISNIIEKQFGLGNIAGKFLGIGDDLRESFQLDQSEFQNAVTGNGVSCAQKFKGTRIEKPWTTPMVWSGNVVPGFHDNSGSYGRRMAVFLFPNLVLHADGGLFERMMQEFPRFICKCNRIYRNMMRRYGQKGIWEILPQEFVQQRQELTSGSNALVGFLGSNQVRRDPTNVLYISLESLRDAVLGYAIRNNLEKPQWGPDYYRGPVKLAGLDITPAETRRKYPRHGDRMVRGPFVIGIDLEINCEIAESNGQESFAAIAAAADAANPQPANKRQRVIGQ